MSFESRVRTCSEQILLIFDYNSYGAICSGSQRLLQVRRDVSMLEILRPRSNADFNVLIGGR